MLSEFLHECFPEASIAELEILAKDLNDPDLIVTKLIYDEYEYDSAAIYDDSSNDALLAQLMEVFPDLDSIFLEYFIDLFQGLEIDEIVEEVSFYLSNNSHKRKPKKNVHKMPLTDFLKADKDYSITMSKEISFAAALRQSTQCSTSSPMGLNELFGIKERLSQSPTYYRELAEYYYSRRCELLRKASAAYRNNGKFGRSIASHYAKEAGDLFDKIEMANNQAAYLIFTGLYMAFLTEETRISIVELLIYMDYL